MKFLLLTVALAFVSSQGDARITRDLRQDGETSGKPMRHTRTVGTGEARSRTKHAVEAQGRHPGSKSRTKSRTKVGTNETPMHHTRTVGTGEARSRTKHTVEAQGRQPGSKSRTKSRTKVGTKETQERQESKPDGEPRDAGCINLGGWVDSVGDGCEYYERYEDACAYYGTDIGTEGLTALEACCVCDEPIDYGDDIYLDNDDGANDDALCPYENGGWVDSVGDGCDFYAEMYDHCAYSGTDIGTEGLTALEACCVCDGVEPIDYGDDIYGNMTYGDDDIYGNMTYGDDDIYGNMTYGDDYLDNDDGANDDALCDYGWWVDRFGYGCFWYELYPEKCALYSTTIGTEGLTPGQACCVCDGY